MRMTGLMSEALVLPELKGRARDDVLEEIVVHMVEHSSLDLDRASTLTKLVDRERLASTAVGHGIAIPHAKLPGLSQAIACLARSSDGVDFGSRDGAPTRLLLTILAPEGNAGLHLKALARASRLLMDEAFRAKLDASTNAEEIWDAIVEQDANLST